MGRTRTAVHEPLAAALDRAATAVGEARFGEALAAALVAWRAVRDPALADAIEQLARLVPAAAPLPAKGGRAQDDAYEARAAANDPADFAVLAALPLPRSLDGIAARLLALAERPPDPRLLTHVFGLLDAPPHSKPPWWKLALAIVGKVAEPRSIARLEALAARVPQLAIPSAQAYVHRRIGEARETLRKALLEAPVAADPAALARLVAAIAAHAAATVAADRDGAALLAAIYDDPTDDRARQVYGDWLQERGDPRGELIALQLSPPPLAPEAARRVRSLIAQHATTWLGPIAPVVATSRSRFARGFLSLAHVHAREAQLRASVGSREWATVEELRFTSHAGDAMGELVCDAAMRGLRAVHGLELAAATMVATASPPLALRELGVMFYDQLPDGVATCAGLPQLTTLALSQPGFMMGGTSELAELAASPIGARLHELALVTDRMSFTLVRSSRGALDVLRIELAKADDQALLWAREHVDGIVHELASPIAAVELISPAPLSAAKRAGLLGALARLAE